MNPTIMMAVALLVPMKDSGVKGTITFTQESGYVAVAGEVTGLKPGKHGFHIHQFGDLRAADGTSAGGHFNPKNTPHGAPEAGERHGGDLGNIDANDRGVATINMKAMGLTVNEILGRAVVVHADPDDFTTQPTGNAGARSALGVIGIAEVKPPADATKK